MKKIITALVLSSAALSANAANLATANIAGLNLVGQRGTITNNAASSANITSIVYRLGTPSIGSAIWDSNFGVSFSGGSPSDFLSDNRYFQTITFDGLNIAAGSSYFFNGLDMDLIQSLSPLSVTGAVIDTVGTSLIGASMSIFWSNGDSATTSLAQQAWTIDQNLSFTAATSSVPVPAAAWLFATGLAGFAGFRRKS